MPSPRSLSVSVELPAEVFQLESQKKKRASRPKVRTGCISCKARHVKCDERKPSCLRCEKAKQPCGGYVSREKPPPNPFNSSRTILPRADFPQSSGLHIHVPRSRQSVFLSGADVGYFDYFRHSLIHDLSGQLNSNFWTKTVLYECMTDPCTRYAVLAIGALSRGLSLPQGSQDFHRVPISSVREGPGDILNDHHRSAICHHTKAISAFRDRVAHHATPRAVLVTTLLLITFELLQGNLAAADALISTALELQKDYLDARSSPTSSVAEDLDELAFMLVRLSMFCSYNPFFVSQNSTIRIHKCPPPQHIVPGEYETDESIGKPSNYQAWMKTNVAHTLTLWNHFGTNCLVFVYNNAKVMEPALMESTQAQFLAHLSRWREVLQRYLGVPAVDLTSQRSIKVALIQLRKYYVCVKSVLDPTWLTWDEFGPEYTAIINEVAEIMPEPEAPTIGPAPVVEFTFDVFLLPLLVFVICKCRVLPDERLRALELLETRLTWREGGWDARVLAKGLRALVALEEAGSIVAADGSRFIPPHSRYHWTSARWDEETCRRKLIATCTRCIPDKLGQQVQVELSVDLARRFGGAEDSQCNDDAF